MEFRGYFSTAMTIAFLAMGCGTASAEVWTVPGAYTLKVDGWSRAATPEGFNYRCTKCSEQIEIEVKYGPPLSPTATWKTNDELMADLSTPEKRQTFADVIMKGAVPSGIGAKVAIKRVALEQIGGLRVLMMASEVEIGRSLTLDTSMVAIHKNRLMRISIHFFEGAMTAENREAINAFMDGLAFEK